jgi:hypothetical protein
MTEADFDSRLTNMGLKNKHGVDMKDVWSDGIWTHLGMMTHGFPNMFMTYSPQGKIVFLVHTRAVELISFKRLRHSQTDPPSLNAKSTGSWIPSLN